MGSFVRESWLMIVVSILSGLAVAGVYRVMDASGRLAGWGLQADGAGFQGTIKLVVGLDPQCRTVTGVEVLEMSETPGLGAKITESQWRAQFSGKSVAEPLEVVKSEPSRPHHVHAITAATISSQAVVTIVNDKVAQVKDQLAKEAGL